MPRVLEAVCKSLDWVMGVHWSVDPEAQVLCCAEMHVAPPRLLQEMVKVNRRVTFRQGIGLPGRVWSTGRAAWIADVIQESLLDVYASFLAMNDTTEETTEKE